MTKKRRNQAIIGGLILVAAVLLVTNRGEAAEWLNRNGVVLRQAAVTGMLSLVVIRWIASSMQSNEICSPSS